MENIIDGKAATNLSPSTETRVTSPARQAYQIGALALARLSHEFDR